MPAARGEEPEKPAAAGDSKKKPGAGANPRPSAVPGKRSITGEKPKALGAKPVQGPASSDDPFGIESAKASPTLPPLRGTGSGSSRVIVALGSMISVFALAGVGYFYWTQARSERGKSTAAGADAYQVPSRNYGFTPPSPQWRIDKARADAERADLAFRHAGSNAWLTIKTTPAKRTEEKSADHEGAEAVWRDWRRRSPNLAEEEPVAAKLGDRPARLLVARDLVAGVEWRAYVCVDEGTVYRLEIEAPDRVDPELEHDFSLAARQFHFLVARSPVQPTQPVAASEYVFRGKALDYTIEVPEPGWREVPLLASAGPYADLLLLGPDRVTQLIVAPRASVNMDGVEKAFRRRVEKWSEAMTVRPLRQELSLDGRPAVRLEIESRNSEGEFVSLVTFVKGERHIFRIEGRAPARSIATAGPVLAQIADSFRIRNEVPKPVAAGDEKSADAAAKQAPGDQVAAAMPTKAPAERGPSAPRVRRPEPEKIIRATERREPMRTLDDLD